MTYIDRAGRSSIYYQGARVEDRCTARHRSEMVNRVQVPGEYELPLVTDENKVYSPWLSIQHFELIKQASMNGDDEIAGWPQGVGSAWPHE